MSDYHLGVGNSTRAARIATVAYPFGYNGGMRLPPIDNKIVSRLRPRLPDKYLTLLDMIYYSSDLACWKADKAEALLSGVKEA